MNTRMPQKTHFSPIWLLFAMAILCAAMLRNAPSAEIRQPGALCDALEPASLHIPAWDMAPAVCLLTPSERDAEYLNRISQGREMHSKPSFKHAPEFYAPAQGALAPRLSPLQTESSPAAGHTLILLLPSWRGLVSFAQPPPST